MTTTPNLPPLPEGLQCMPPIFQQWAHNHAVAAYQAGRDAALDEAARICDERAMKNEAAISDDEPDETSSLRSAAWQMSVCANDIRKIKSDTKGGV